MVCILRWLLWACNKCSSGLQMSARQKVMPAEKVVPAKRVTARKNIAWEKNNCTSKKVTPLKGSVQSDLIKWIQTGSKQEWRPIWLHYIIQYIGFCYLINYFKLTWSSKTWELMQNVIYTLFAQKSSILIISETIKTNKFFNLSVLNALNRKSLRLNLHVFHGKVGLLIVSHESST